MNEWVWLNVCFRFFLYYSLVKKKCTHSFTGCTSTRLVLYWTMDFQVGTISLEAHSYDKLHSYFTTAH